MTSLAKPVTEFPHKGFKYLKLIHQSPHYIAVYKPAHTTCQDEPDNPSSLSNLLRRKTPELFTAREHPFHAPKGVHRLDLQVTGCVLYGTSAYGTRQLAKNFRKRTVQKGYLAILSKLDATTAQHDGMCLHASQMGKDSQVCICVGYDLMRAEITNFESMRPEI
ncbi:protein of unknown function [Taphrina deformans PYCC 5710]|uniref:Pseudouridine synthase RsuA/RluA-like domain-containing protein n=1 Tax=Taphrina deformans (strain PYCC 5710 / ATCC 11124 / CBS 356.35 / IMI 108563 / JCM 9778 / NBRC 8474) TaxID=1097556 RepID=R4XF58_TAPDE|nr:protein of unknown function [Taphrina deformans PYCC 5710]|eukprot:CCG81992.1 protein of unknown function [Taphrina deformans PYCC 5710]